MRALMGSSSPCPRSCSTIAATSGYSRPERYRNVFGFAWGGGGSLWQVRLLPELFDLYESEQLPLRRLGYRSLLVWLRHWRDPLDLFGALVRLKIFHRPIKSLYGD